MIPIIRLNISVTKFLQYRNKTLHVEIPVRIVPPVQRILPTSMLDGLSIDVQLEQLNVKTINLVEASLEVVIRLPRSLLSLFLSDRGNFQKFLRNLHCLYWNSTLEFRSRSGKTLRNCLIFERYIANSIYLQVIFTASNY